MSDPVQLEEKSAKSKVSKQSKKSSVKQQSNEGSEKASKHNKEEIKSSENNDNKQEESPQQVLSTRAYLEQNVVPVVQEALLECARKRPENPLEFVGNYILNRAKGK
jgi:hypothetical protein